MILPIVAYGDPLLKKQSKELRPRHPQLTALIEDMFETMYHSHGVGLAAPQIGQNIRLFVADATPMDKLIKEDKSTLKGWKRVFINPEILEESDEEWSYEEGCLSIPDIREDVWRSLHVRVKYLDENFDEKVEELSYMRARIVLHEFDHLEGILFTDYLSGLKKQLLRPRLNRISKGNIDTRYPMRFPKLK